MAAEASVDYRLGNKRRFYLTADTSGSLAGKTPTWVAGEQTNSLNRSADSIEVSDKASGDWKKFIPGTKSMTADVTIYADDSNEQQKKLLNALYGGQTVFCFVGEVSDSTPSSGEAFEAIITAINDTNDNNAVSTRQVSLQSTGAVVRIPAE